MKIKDLFLISAMVLPMMNGCLSETGGFTPAEKAIIHDADSIMRVLTIEDSLDLEVLRNTSTDLSPEAINSKDFIKLSDLMLRTVTHPSQDGVGLAAPQVGINRRIVAVQRFDKAGEPFEVYPNIHLVWTSDSLAYGPEGCLSVPDRREEVLRSQEIIIEYASADEPEISVRDTVRGFTAVIFQHEIDHLDGLLYTDRL